MDPFSSLETVKDIGSIINAIIHYANAIKNAPESHQSLLEELTDIQDMLRRLESSASKHGSNDISPSPMLSHEDEGRFKKLQVTLNDALRWIEEVNPQRMSILHKAFWPLQKRKQNIEQLLRDMERFKSQSTLNLMIRTREEWKLDINAWERDDIIQWLKVPTMQPYNVRHDASVQSSHFGTCQWLLEDDMFTQWRLGSGFLWLHGLPGSGKTVLASSVIETLEGDGNLTVAYHYCDFSDNCTTSSVSILRSLLIQLLASLEKDWTRDFADLVSRKKRQRGPPTGLPQLTELIAKASKYTHSTVVVVDALDECKRREDLKSLGQLSEESNIAVFVTSRKEPDISAAFCNLPTISLDDERGEMEVTIRRSREMCRIPHLREEIGESSSKRENRLPTWCSGGTIFRLVIGSHRMFFQYNVNPRPENNLGECTIQLTAGDIIEVYPIVKFTLLSHVVESVRIDVYYLC